jgi:hypothetical protein
VVVESMDCLLLILHIITDSSRSCLLHRFIKNEWRVLSSQTIGVEFASKIIRVGTGSRRKRIKLQVRITPTLSPIQDTYTKTCSSGTLPGQNDFDQSRARITAEPRVQSLSTISLHIIPSPDSPPLSMTRAHWRHQTSR